MEMTREERCREGKRMNSQVKLTLNGRIYLILKFHSHFAAVTESTPFCCFRLFVQPLFLGSMVRCWVRVRETRV